MAYPLGIALGGRLVAVDDEQALDTASVYLVDQQTIVSAIVKLRRLGAAWI